MIKTAINVLQINIEKKQIEASKQPFNKKNNDNSFDINNPDALIETFYSNVEEFSGGLANSDSNEINEEDKEAFDEQLIIPQNLELLKLVNPSLSEFMERNEYERVTNTNRKLKEAQKEREKQKEPKCIPNNGLIRLFAAYSGEIIYEKIKILIDNGHINKYESRNDAVVSYHPIANYCLNRFFNHNDYEHYMANLILPVAFKFQDSCKINPRYALLAYAASFERPDSFIKFNGIQMTFKSILYTLLNAEHLSGNKTLNELFSLNPTFEGGEDVIEEFLYKMWVASKDATYIIAISAATGQKATVTRFDSAILYTCNLSGKDLPIMTNSETLYYDNKESGGGWIFRLSNSHKTSYYAKNIETVFKEKIKTIL